MVEIVVRVENLSTLLSKLAPELYLPAIAQLMNDAATLAERVAREGAPKDTGALARSITSEVQPLEARIYSPLQYAAVMEEGRSAGATMPPPDALVGWMGRHGIPPQMAFVVARAIGRRGIQGRFFMRAAMQAVHDAAPRLMDVAAQKISGTWSG